MPIYLPIVPIYLSIYLSIYLKVSIYRLELQGSTEMFPQVAKSNMQPAYLENEI